MADIAELGFNVETQSLERGSVSLDKLGSSAEKASRHAEGMETTMGRLSDSVSRITSIFGLAASAFGAFGLGQLLSDLRSEQEQLQRNMLRTEQIVKSTGMTAGFTAQQLHEQARALALATLGSTEGIMEAQQVMLTFRSVSGDTFTRAIELASDLATVTGTSLTSSVTQLGKALEDPVRGITALRRSGVSFAEAQQDLIKSLVETGQEAKAQTLILDELARQYGGVAKSEAGGLAGAQDTLGQATQEAKIALSEYFDLIGTSTSIINAAANRIFEFTEALKSGDYDTAIIGVKGLAGGLAVLATTYIAVKSSSLVAAAGLAVFNAALAANPITLLVGALSLLIGGFFALRNEIVKVGETTATVGDFVRSAWQETGGRLIEITKTAWNNISDETLGYLDVAKSVALTVLQAFANSWEATLAQAQVLVNGLIGIFVGLGRSIGTVVAAIVDWFRNGFGRIKDLAMGLGQGILSALNPFEDADFSAFDNAVQAGLVNPITNAVSTIQQEMQKAFSTDYVGELATGFGAVVDEVKLSLDGMAGSILENAAAQRKARGDTEKTSEGTLTLGANLNELKQQLDETTGGIEDFSSESGGSVETQEELSEALLGVVDSLREQSAAYQAVQDTFDSHISRLEDEHARLTLSAEAYRIYQLEKQGIVGWMQDEILQREANNAQLVEEAKRIEESAAAQQRFVDSVGSAFDKLWSDMISGSKSAADAVIDTIKAMLLSIVQTVLRNKIVIPIATTLVGGSATASTAIGGIQTSLTSGINSLINPLLSGIGDTFENIGASLFGTGPGTNPLFGASTVPNWAYGLAGIGGGFVGQELFGGQGGLGGSLGATAGYALGAGSSTLINILGASLAGPVGAVLGALLGGAIGGLFGDKKPSNKAAFGSIDLDTLETTTGAFTGKKAPSEETLAIRDAFLDTISATVRGIEKLGGEALGKIFLDIGERDGVQVDFGIGQGIENLGKDAEAALETIMERIIMDAEGLSEPFKTLAIIADGVEETLQQIEALGAIQEVLDSDPFEAYAQAVEQANRSVWQAAAQQLQATSQLVSAYDGSVSATQELAIAAQSSYQAIVAVVAQIDQLSKNVSQSFASSIENIQLSILDTAEKYEFFQDKAEQAFLALQEAVDPQAIAEAAKEFEKYANAAFGLLDAEQQQALAPGFINALESAGEIAQAGFEEAQNIARSEMENLFARIEEKLAAVAAQFNQAGDKQQQAANVQLQAAQTPQQIVVVGAGGSEEGF